MCSLVITPARSSSTCTLLFKFIVGFTASTCKLRPHAADSSVHQGFCTKVELHCSKNYVVFVCKIITSRKACFAHSLLYPIQLSFHHIHICIHAIKCCCERALQALSGHSKVKGEYIQVIDYVNSIHDVALQYFGTCAFITSCSSNWPNQSSGQEIH